MRIAIPALFAVTLTAFTGVPAGAEDFNCYPEEYVVVPIADQAYVDIRALYGVVDPADKYILSVYFYRESNGEPGLQRGAEGDYCVESATPDSWLM